MTNESTIINAEEIHRGQNFMHFGHWYKATEVRVLSESVTIDVEGSSFGIQYAQDEELEVIN